MKQVVIMLYVSMSCLSFAIEPFQSWQSVDEFIQASYDELESASALFPPSNFHLGVSLGFFPFNDANFSNLINTVTPRMCFDVPVYDVRVCETNGLSRLFVTEINGICLHTNQVAFYDMNAWVRMGYGEPPQWITGDKRTQWYQVRYRNRIEFCFTLIPSNDYARYREAIRLATTNHVASDSMLVKPADTNCLAFAQVDYDLTSTNFTFQLYSPQLLPVDLFTTSDLRTHWTYVGTIYTTDTFTPLSIYSPTSTGFFRVARGDMDSDGDGIPDGMETFHFGTNPYLWDSSGDGMSDWMKLYRYGLDPLLRDSDDDGYDDDEEILAEQNPSVFTEGATASIRYYYDEDDHLIGSYCGANQGTVTVQLTPTGNPSTLQFNTAPTPRPR